MTTFPTVLTDLCTRCGSVQPVRVIQHPSGTEWRCLTCGGQTDFMHNEEDDDFDYDPSMVG